MSVIDELQSVAFAVPIFYGDFFIILMNWFCFVLYKCIITAKLTVLLAHELFGLGGTCYQS